MVPAKMAALRAQSAQAVDARVKTTRRTNAFCGVLPPVFVRGHQCKSNVRAVFVSVGKFADTRRDEPPS